VAVLRAPDLLELVKPAGPSIFSWVSHGPRRLRKEVDELWSQDAHVAGSAACDAARGSQFCGSGLGKGFPENGRLSRSGGCGVTRGRDRCGAVLGRAETAVVASTDHGSHTVVTACLCGGGRTTHTGAACRIDGGHRGSGRIFFSALGVIEFRCDCGVTTASGKAVGVGRFELSTFVLSDRMYRGLAMPWLEATVQPYARARRGRRDATKDVSHEPWPTQFRIDLRLLARAMESRLPPRIARVPGNALVGGIAFSFRVWKFFVLTLVLQIGLLPLLASEFHRVTFAGIFVNSAAVPLTAIIVPLGFCALIRGFLWPALGKILAGAMSIVTAGLLQVVQRFALVRQLSYRTPGPSL
jgi:hypothetical protein